MSYSVAVRALCEFAAKAGDLDHRFTPSPSAQDGIKGHQTVAARRGSARRSEVPVSGQYKDLLVRGRADGFIASEGLVEEVKTYRGDLARMPANHRALHWAQAKVYGALLCAQLELTELKISLVYFETSRQDETVLVESCRAAELQEFFAALCGSFLAWGAQEAEHRQRRDEALSALRFPHATYRTGQRQLAENVFRAARRGRCLMAQAPTGMGKTIGTIFPLLKACASEGLDKVFFVTAKGSGQPLARSAIETLRASGPGLPLRVIELISRDKSCEHPGKACHGEDCPLARGFYDRLPAARSEAVGQPGGLDPDTIRRVARGHGVCPYYLTQELVRWADVVIADYNYLFDTTAALYAMTLANEWKVAILVDEAHNLVDRARAMYSAELSENTLTEVRHGASPSVKPVLDRLARAWRVLSKSRSGPSDELVEIPDRLLRCLGDVTAAIGDRLAEAPEDVGGELLRFYFDALHFSRLAESFGSHSLIDLTLESVAGVPGRMPTMLSIRNVVPASFLRPRYACAATTVMFSATLMPQKFYSDLLGLPNDTAWLDVESPFDASQLSVEVVRSISTRYADRPASLRPIARLIAHQFATEPGNYLAFFSSFDYMEQTARALADLCPAVPTWSQARRQSDSDRSAFLDRFSAAGRGVGFAVLGGSFGEGIDLPGRRLIGAFIATLGLPPINAVNERIRRKLEQIFGPGRGYDYTYLYPGLRKVAQAAGRVIRTSEDVGVVYLIDDRFGGSNVKALLPSWWRTGGSRSCASSVEGSRAASSYTENCGSTAS